MLISSEQQEISGKVYLVELHHDADHGAPWEEEDGHGPVSDWTTRAKRPGELELCRDGSLKRFYDFSEAVKQARREGWDSPPYGGTVGEKAARAARADYERLRQWCADLWHYVGVVVKPVCDCCDQPDDGRAESLWGIESDSGDYLDEVAQELAEEIEATQESAA